MTTTIGGSNPTVVFPDGSTQNTAAVSATVTSISGQNNTATSFLGIPNGTTAERPASPQTGALVLVWLSCGRRQFTEYIGLYCIHSGSRWPSLRPERFFSDVPLAVCYSHIL